jgi:hypothetical protein
MARLADARSGKVPPGDKCRQDYVGIDMFGPERAEPG